MKKTAVRSFDPDIAKMLAITIVIFVIMVVLNGNFAKSSNLTSMCYQLPELGLYSLAMMMVMLTGGIDYLLSLLEICPRYWQQRS